MQNGDGKDKSLIITREGLILTQSIRSTLQGWIFGYIPAGRAVLTNPVPRDRIFGSIP